MGKDGDFAKHSHEVKEHGGIEKYIQSIRDEEDRIKNAEHEQYEEHLNEQNRNLVIALICLSPFAFLKIRDYAYKIVNKIKEHHRRSTKVDENEADTSDDYSTHL